MRYIDNMVKQIAFLLIFAACFSLSAKEKKPGEIDPQTPKKYSGKNHILGPCKGAQGSQELWINNVRTIVFTAGDMWWDLFGNGHAYYMVPGVQNKAQGISSSFAGSIWIGGYDAGGQLKVAAMTYRQTGYDFWPGPLDKANASTDEVICNAYDKLFYVTRAEAEAVAYGLAPPSDNIKKWPGNGDVTKGHDNYLAPFYDLNQDGYYDPAGGDYPDFDVYNKGEKDNLGVCKARLYGDAALWWVFNDKGDIHTETGSAQSIGLEIRAQAFAFKTNDDINNMTFYNYEVINRSSFSLNQTYFTVWTDADLGCFLDDYVGCDIERGLGYIYNGDNNDADCSGSRGYGEYIPSMGCDFFKGPLADPNDGVDNDFDGVTDELGETIGMSKFIYYNNNWGAAPFQMTNPQQAVHYYGYMTGYWKDGSQFTEGGNAYGGTTPVNYVYPGDPVTNTGWTEANAANTPDDRRFLQSAGPFKLEAGAVNNVTFGMPWAMSPIKNNAIFAISLLRVADDKAQALFDNCFKIVDGPEAPDMTIQETNNELLIYLTNKPTSNNWLNQYQEKDPLILPVPGQTISALANPDQTYRFEGYKVYQVKDNTVSQTDIEDQTKAKLVFQCDLKNGVSRLINYSFDPAIGADVPKVKVEGVDNGIVTTFKVTEDAFASGTDTRLVNNKTYYFMAFAYAYNNYCTYKPDTDPGSNPTENFYGQKKPYLEGRKVKKAAGIPHAVDAEKDGTIAQSIYGYGPKIMRIEGQGNGGNSLDLTQASVDEILANGFAKQPVYENGRGPIKVKVVDPLNIPNAEFSLKFLKLSPSKLTATNPAPLNWTSNLQYTYSASGAKIFADSTTWLLNNLNTGKTYQPNKAIKIGEEYYFSELGLSVNIEQVVNPCESQNNTLAGYQTGDFIEASMTFANPQLTWLSGLGDRDGDSPLNWIKSGTKETSPNASVYDDIKGAAGNFTDPNQLFSNIIPSVFGDGGTWAPYCLTAFPVDGQTSAQRLLGPGYEGSRYYKGDDSRNKTTDVDPRNISSVDVVITPDQSKWTRCIVLETQTDPSLAEGGARYFTIRKHASVDKNGVAATTTVGSTNPSDPNYIYGEGMGWFPGYAINVETGERLNMAFGENSYDYANNGNDMIWNPTTTRVDNAKVSSGNTAGYHFGGRHYIYVFGHNYDAKYIVPSTETILAPLDGKPMGAGRYDGGKQMYDQWRLYSDLPSNTSAANVLRVSTALAHVIRDAMWVNIPIIRTNPFGNDGKGDWLKDPKNIPTEAKIKLRVKKPYRYGYATNWSYERINPKAGSTYTALGGVNYVNNTYTSTTSGTVVTTINYLPIDTSLAPQNANMPMYKFSTSDIYTQIADATTLKNALDLIKIVPNPYYGYSSYESKRLDTRIRITNLPNNCVVKIYTINGTLVRTLKRDVSGQEDLSSADGSDFKQSKRSPYMDWDLQNQSGVPIASGLYIFHIDVPGVGEKILKWFGVMRPQDLQGF